MIVVSKPSYYDLLTIAIKAFVNIILNIYIYIYIFCCRDLGQALICVVLATLSSFRKT